MTYDIHKISAAFAINGDFLKADTFGAGHINDTYRVTFSDSTRQQSYIIQRINHHVFTNPMAMMDNIMRVTKHIDKRILTESNGDRASCRQSLRLIQTRDGGVIYQDDTGNFWRGYHFIENAFTLDQGGTETEMYEAARAFAWFQRMLTDLPGPRLTETIPHFHDGPHRLADFHEALEADIHNRAKNARTEIAFLQRHADIFEVVPRLVAENRIPERITHNDTKINNVLLDQETQEGICVIDLDTVMPGYTLYDFGDLVRTTISSAAEDESNLERVSISKTRFKAVLEGYLSEAGLFLNECEIAHLPFSARLITLMIGTRFLTDYLNGDTYFKTQRPNQNLERARVQFKIVQHMLDAEEELEGILKACTGRA